MLWSVRETHQNEEHRFDQERNIVFHITYRVIPYSDIIRRRRAYVKHRGSRRLGAAIQQVARVKLQIGVMGSSGGALSNADIALARRLGACIARRGALIVTGACPGLPHAAVLGAHDAGGDSLGISPAHSREEHIELYESPTEPYTAIAFAGSGLMGREVDNIHSSDFVLFIGGRSGTLGEFCIAYDEGKLIGILRNSGGIADHIGEIAVLFQKDTGATILEDDDPERLVDRCAECFATDHRPSAVAFEEVPRG
jgi:uncharacterized protein (TIGR00725 family)